MDYILTLDIGTTHVKALAFNMSLEVLDEEEFRINTYSPEQQFQQQDPDEILETCQLAIEKLLDRLAIEGLCAIVFSNAMHSIFPVDDKGSPLYPAIIWSDLRASELSFQISKTKELDALYNSTGTPLHPMSPLLKILWLRENERELFEKAEKFISLKEYILFRWFGEYITDYSTASATGLFDINKFDWNREALNIAGITSSSLPIVLPIDHSFKSGNSNFLRKLNASSETPVFLGATDGCLAVLGAGNSDKSELSITIGTSAAVRTVKAKPVQDTERRVFNYYLEKDTYISGGPSNNGGNLLDWSKILFLDTGQNSSYSQQWSDLIKRTSPAEDAIVFIPYIYGERAPIWQPGATGSFHGIKHIHSKDLFARSVLEGMLMNIRSIADIVNPEMDKKVIASGGVFKIKGMAQICSDILFRPVKILDHTNLSARGAAIMGWKTLGKTILETGVESDEYSPGSENSQIYSTLFTKFKALLTTYQHQLEI